jgi:hypothetical protein
MKLKSELYNKEQNEICNKIITILNLDSNSSFILKELDYDEEKKRMILELIPDIRRYFSFSSIIGVADTEKAKRPYMSIIRQICKLKYNVIGKNYMLRKPNEKEVKTMKYFFYIKQ